jgi:mRNA interferase MazF
MERFVKGDIVVVPFPFSDLSNAKRRPALVVQPYEGEDLLLAQITSRPIRNEYALLIDEDDFAEGSLQRVSNVRPDKLFTCAKDIIVYRVGRLKQAKIDEVIETIKKLLDK